jgi:hypothetical protein
VLVVAAVPLYPPGSRVGAWLSTHECLRALVARGHRVEVVAYMTSGDAYDLDGVSVHDRRSLRLVASADLVVSHMGDDGKAHQTALDRGIPSVRMVHGWAADPEERLAGASLVVFNSEASRAEIGFAGPSVVAHPVTWPQLHATMPGDRVTLVNTSREKGGELFWLLARSMHDVSFLGVRGDYGRQMRRSAKPPNLDVISSTENMRADVWARTRVLLMPSERETWGMTGVEALASGIPVIAHPTAGLLESLGDAGVFVDRGDAAGWRDAIRALLDPDAYADAAARALARSRQLDPVRQLAIFADAVEALELAAA